MMDRWEHCLGGDTKYITRNIEPTELDDQVFELVYDKYLKKYGLPDKVKSHLEDKKRVAIMMAEYIENRNKSLLNQIRYEMALIEKNDPAKEKGMTYDECFAFISEKAGFPVKKIDTSIVEFKAYMERYGSNK